MDAIVYRLRFFAAVLTGVLVTGTAGFMWLERSSFVDALYYTVVTVATVGYGDITPRTHGGKFLAMGLIVVGVGTFLGVFANATELLLVRRQERLRRERLSMAIGLFLSEIGTELLRMLAGCDPDLTEIRATLAIRPDWGKADFGAAARAVASREFRLDPERVPLDRLHEFLSARRDLLLRLLENPNLVEHEAFTDLLRAVFHLKEELASRPGFSDLPETDRNHLAGDAKRVYPLLARQWLEHMSYLKASYSYLYSLAVRTNPFSQAASAVVR